MHERERETELTVDKAKPETNLICAVGKWLSRDLHQSEDPDVVTPISLLLQDACEYQGTAG